MAKKSGSGAQAPKASRKTTAKEERKPKGGRAPLERDVIVFVRGVPFFRTSLYSMNKRKGYKYWMGAMGTDVSKKSDSEADLNEDDVGDETPIIASSDSTAVIEPETMYVFSKHGRGQPTAFEMTPEEVAEFEELQQAIRDSKGIHIDSFLRGSELERFPIGNAYALDPNQEDEVSLEAYAALHGALFGTTVVAFGHCWSGKTAYMYFGIYACPEGLVLRKLPFKGEYHVIEDAVRPQWRNVEPGKRLREQMGTVIDRFRQDAIIGEDLVHPEEAFLAALTEGNHLLGVKPEESDIPFANAGEALEALLSRPKRTSPTAELRRSKPR